MTQAFLCSAAQQGSDYISNSVTYFRLCCSAEFLCKSSLPDKPVLVSVHLSTATGVMLRAVHEEHTLAASVSAREMTRYTANLLERHW